MDTVTQAELLIVGLRTTGVALILGSLMLLATGSAGPLGGTLRQALEPALHAVRARTSLSRSELADVTILAAVALAVGSIVAERRYFAVIMVVGLWLARPGVQRLTSQENKMLAIASYFSIDFLIGLYAPIVVANLLLGNVLLASSLLAVVIALSWPTGGGTTIPGRRWHLAPIGT